MSIEDGLKATREAREFRERLLAEVQKVHLWAWRAVSVQVCESVAIVSCVNQLRSGGVPVPLEFFGTPRLNSYLCEAVYAL